MVKAEKLTFDTEEGPPEDIRTEEAPALSADSLYDTVIRDTYHEIPSERIAALITMAGKCLEKREQLTGAWPDLPKITPRAAEHLLEVISKTKALKIEQGEDLKDYINTLIGASLEQSIEESLERPRHLRDSLGLEFGASPCDNDFAKAVFDLCLAKLFADFRASPLSESQEGRGQFFESLKHFILLFGLKPRDPHNPRWYSYNALHNQPYFKGALGSVFWPHTYPILKIIKHLSEVPESEHAITDLISSFEAQEKTRAKEYTKRDHPTEILFLRGEFLSYDPEFDQMERQEKRGELAHMRNSMTGPWGQVYDAAIRALGKINSPESIPAILDITEKETTGYHILLISQTLEQINPDSAGQQIISRLSSEKLNNQQRAILARILFRLELGRVGISEEGLEYLGHRFDLGEYNDPANFAHRITPDGKVGIFGPERNLEGFVQLEAGDFTGDEQSIRKQVLDITYDMLFIPRPDETTEERQLRESILEEFKASFFDTYLGFFAHESTLRFNNLSLPEQGWILTFLKDADSGKKEDFFWFVNKYGEDGFCAFRSMEFDLLTGNRILTLEGRLGEQKTRTLLKEYRTTYDLAERLANHIAKMLEFQENELEINLIRENILAAAQGLLVDPAFLEDSNLSRLSLFNHDIELGLSLPPTTDGFIEGQLILGRFLRDNVSDFSREGDTSLLVPAVIARRLEQLYDNPEFSLRNYEGKTTDTATSLQHIVPELEDFYMTSTTGSKKLKIYDIGAGEGRIAIPLALLGHQVVGIDISQRMVSQVPERTDSAIKDLGEKGGDPLAQAAREAFRVLGKRPDMAAEPSENIDIRQGDFFEFGQSEFQENFGEPADAAIIMWHTLGFAGTPEGMHQVLKKAFDNLRPGGKILIEMPDRNFGGYARAIREYHRSNPDQPFGAIVDAPSQGDRPTEENSAISSARYFPSDTELLTALETAGFSFEKIDSYFVRGGEDKGRLVIKENLYVATKPMDKEGMDLLHATMAQEHQQRKTA